MTRKLQQLERRYFRALSSGLDSSFVIRISSFFVLDERNHRTQSSARPQSRPPRRYHDRDWLDDWIRHFYCVGRILAADWRLGLAVADVGRRRIADNYRSTLLRGIGHDDAARGRRLRFPARSLRTGIRLFVWLDA